MVVNIPKVTASTSIVRHSTTASPTPLLMPYVIGWDLVRVFPNHDRLSFVATGREVAASTEVSGMFHKSSVTIHLARGIHSAYPTLRHLSPVARSTLWDRLCKPALPFVRVFVLEYYHSYALRLALSQT